MSIQHKIKCLNLQLLTGNQTDKEENADRTDVKQFVVLSPDGVVVSR